MATAARPASKRGRREASVEKLLAAGLARFVAQGYRATTVEQIAAAAGLTKGSFYFYFKSKEALLLRLLDEVERVVVDEIPARVAGAAGAPAKLVAFMHGQARLGVTSPDHVLLLILMSLEFAHQDDAIRRRVQAIQARLYRTLEAVIEQGKARGAFRRDVASREQAAIVMALHDGTFLEWYRRGHALDGAELVRALRASMLAGLAADAAAAPVRTEIAR